MKRMKVLMGQRRMQVLITLAVLLLAVGVVVASSASFTASTANAGNVFTAGTLSMTNSDAPGSIMVNVTNMRPGDTQTGSVTLSNTGDVPGAFSLTKNLVADAGGLGDVLQLSIDEGAANVYAGDLSGAISGLSLGIWQSSGVTQTHTYDFTVTWPNAHPGDGGSDAADTAVMGESCSYSFTWNAVANSTIN